MKKYILLLPILLLLIQPAYGDSLEESVGLSELRQASRVYLDSYLDLNELKEGDFQEGARSILEGGLSQLPGMLKRAGRSGVALLTVALLCGLAGSVEAELGGGGLAPIRLVGTAAVTALAAGDIHALMGLGRETLKQMAGFSRLLMPVVTALCAAGGAPASAAARQGVILLFLSLLTTMLERFIAPVIYAYTAAAAAHAALQNEGLGRVADLLRRGAGALLTGVFTLFVTLLSITGAIGGNTDAVAQKAAKAALSGFVPVVGSILSDAAETVAAGAGVLRGTVGVLGMLTVLAVCILPFLRLGVHYLLYKLSAALCATVCPGPVAELIDDLGSAFALLLGLLGGGGFVLYIALITSVKAVVG